MIEQKQLTEIGYGEAKRVWDEGIREYLSKIGEIVMEGPIFLFKLSINGKQLYYIDSIFFKEGYLINYDHVEEDLKIFNEMLRLKANLYGEYLNIPNDEPKIEFSDEKVIIYRGDRRVDRERFIFPLWTIFPSLNFEFCCVKLMWSNTSIVLEVPISEYIRALKFFIEMFYKPY